MAQYVIYLSGEGSATCEADSERYGQIGQAVGTLQLLRGGTVVAVFRDVKGWMRME